MAEHNTLLIRLEGPFQAWGLAESRFAIRRVASAPTKSGVIGLLCAARGIARSEATPEVMKPMASLKMAVRVDRPGTRWLDYHTVGAGGISRRSAEGGLRHGETMLTLREYLGDASFLVALWGEPSLIRQLHDALLEPVWPLYLGRKSCVPSVPLFLKDQGSLRTTANPIEALLSVPWEQRYAFEKKPDVLTVYTDWPLGNVAFEPCDLDTAHDVPVHFIPPAPAYTSRVVARGFLECGTGEGQVRLTNKAEDELPKSPPRPRADYTNAEYRNIRARRLEQDHGLCVFCKAPATTVQHITYRHAGGNERVDELRSLCRLCHDACTMIEYGHNMGMDRINPEDPFWRDLVIQRRREIIRFRSRETRARLLGEKVKE
ncbi:MAG: type I-E CRISPR-associated protein Cas5/CasD [Candidatus Hydrogenedentes bacterium]|nr:type I-E CRISPR-associated protein Cas5/CasD [Candidatus Hydrogenedentota bacterium]